MTSSVVAGSVRRRWPALAGIAFAALVSVGMADGVEQAPVLAAAAMVYIGSAALRKPGAAWPLFLTSVVVITVARFADVDATPIVLGCGVVLGLYGLLRGVLRPGHGLPLQSVALLAFGAVAAIASFVDTDLGAYLVAAGLLTHSAWDLHHYRTNRVVARSLAEFCLLLDASLAVLIIVVTIAA
ncbi:hypothetical protein BJF90_25855 [Pseudonocardia sp. CNS-004]|nr:hypothetical protein BJF90_25855 [Pseudonocardia sp. CNS-004]